MNIETNMNTNSIDHVPLDNDSFIVRGGILPSVTKFVNPRTVVRSRRFPKSQLEEEVSRTIELTLNKLTQVKNVKRKLIFTDPEEDDEDEKMVRLHKHICDVSGLSGTITYECKNEEWTSYICRHGYGGIADIIENYTYEIGMVTIDLVNLSMHITSKKSLLEFKIGYEFTVDGHISS